LPGLPAFDVRIFRVWSHRAERERHLIFRLQVEQGSERNAWYLKKSPTRPKTPTNGMMSANGFPKDGQSLSNVPLVQHGQNQEHSFRLETAKRGSTQPECHSDTLQVPVQTT
jgi:hypothetical protein